MAGEEVMLSFRNCFQSSIYSINAVDKTKLSCIVLKILAIKNENNISSFWVTWQVAATSASLPWD